MFTNVKRKRREEEVKLEKEKHKIERELKRSKRRRNGYSVFAGGGYMRTVSTMKILIVMAKLCPPLLSIILSILLFNNIKTYVSKICA